MGTGRALPRRALYCAPGPATARSCAPPSRASSGAADGREPAGTWLVLGAAVLAVALVGSRTRGAGTAAGDEGTDVGSGG